LEEKSEQLTEKREQVDKLSGNVSRLQTELGETQAK
jgi:hypothetical protein